MVGPTAGASVIVNAKIASPVGCCGLGSLVSTSGSDMGMSTPPEKPCKPRIAIIVPRSWANEQPTENSANRIVLAIR